MFSSILAGSNWILFLEEVLVADEPLLEACFLAFNSLFVTLLVLMWLLAASWVEFCFPIKKKITANKTTIVNVRVVISQTGCLLFSACSGSGAPQFYKIYFPGDSSSHTLDTFSFVILLAICIYRLFDVDLLSPTLDLAHRVLIIDVLDNVAEVNRCQGVLVLILINGRNFVKGNCSICPDGISGHCPTSSIGRVEFPGISPSFNTQMVGIINLIQVEVRTIVSSL